MASFTEYFTNPHYIKAHGIVKKGNENLGFIYIENEKDISFWKVFFGEDVLKSYEFNATKNPATVACGTRGKFRFDELICNANKSAIFALDSDLDHMTPNRFKRCVDIIENPFVIHTFGYGKESFTNSIESLNSCLESYYFYRPSSFKFTNFLENYSSIIYPVFIKFIHLLNHHPDVSDEGEFRKRIIPNQQLLSDMYFDNKFEDAQTYFSAYEQELDHLLNGDDIATTVELCSRFGLKQRNTYQFINGHDLEDKIVKVIVNQIKCNLIAEEMDNYKAEGAQGQLLGDRGRELKTHFDENVRFGTLRSMCTRYSSNDLFRASQEQLTVLQV